MRSRHDSSESPLRRTVLLLLGICLALAVGCEADWKKKAEQAFQRAEALNEAGDYAKAELEYKNALTHNPFHPEANLHLATLLEMRFLDENQALYYYRRFLDLRTRDAVLRERVKVVVGVLEEITLGRIEDPVDATEDFLWAIRNDSNRVFAERLHSDFLKVLFEFGWRATEYYAKWRDERLKDRTPRIVYRNVYKSRGKYRGEVWVDLVSNQTGVAEERRELSWRLEGTLWELSGDETPRKQSQK